MRGSIAIGCLAMAWWSSGGPGGAMAADFVCWKPRYTPATIDASDEDGSAGQSSQDTKRVHTSLEPVTSDELLKPPYKFVGKLAFVMGRSHFVATAVFIAPNMLITAAHNLIDHDDAEASSMTFYRVSTAFDPFRNRFDVEAGAYLSDWKANLDSEPDRYDYAILRTKQSYNDGFLKLKSTDVFKVDDTFDIVAYSDAIGDDDREQMFHKRMTLTDVDDGAYVSRPADPGPGRAFSPGASGGAWLTDRSELFSVEVSGAGRSEDGPIFGAKVEGMVDFVNSSCK